MSRKGNVGVAYCRQIMCFFTVLTGRVLLGIDRIAAMFVHGVALVSYGTSFVRVGFLTSEYMERNLNAVVLAVN